MQDTSANTVCKNKFVYCHNPSPFSKKIFWYLFYDWKFFIWTLLYKYLYAINISSNNAVIVQQEWIAKEFERKFGIKNIIIARPKKSSSQFYAKDDHIKELNFIYPSLARVFKNFELVLNSIDYFNNTYPNHINKISCTLTIDKSSNKFGKYLVNKFGHLNNVNFIGYTDFTEVQAALKKSTIGIFPSKLETWGLPINEYQENNLPIIVADLPYAHETVGNYNKVHFVDPDNYKYLARIFKKIIDGDDIFYEVSYENEKPVINSYDHLVDKIFELSN
jgi:glycosyltransferase involved in cell wall biosynthesis